MAFSLVYPWLESRRLLEIYKHLADFVRIFNIFYSLMTNDEVPRSEFSVPGILFQQEIDLELYMKRMVLHPHLTGLQSLAIKTMPKAVEALKDAQLQGNTEHTRRGLHPVATVREVST